MLSLSEIAIQKQYNDFVLHPFFDQAAKNLSNKQKLDIVEFFVQQRLPKKENPEEAAEKLNLFCKESLKLPLSQEDANTLTDLCQQVALFRLREDESTIKGRLLSKFTNLNPTYFDMCSLAQMVQTQLTLKLASLTFDVLIEACATSSLIVDAVIKVCELFLANEVVYNGWFSGISQISLSENQADMVFRSIIALSALFLEKDEEDRCSILFNLIVEALIESRMGVKGGDLADFLRKLPSRIIPKKEQKNLLNLVVKFVYVYENMWQRAQVAIKLPLQIGKGETRGHKQLDGIQKAISALDYDALSSFM